MNSRDIDEQIKLAVHYKHENKIAQAIALEEECLERCKRETGTQIDGIAMLLKALAKLYYAKKDTEKAKQYFTGAAELYYHLVDQGIQQYEPELMNCCFFLGTCGSSFVRSNKFEEFRHSLQVGGSGFGSLTVPEMQQMAFEGWNTVEKLASSNPGSNVAKIMGRRII